MGGIVYLNGAYRERAEAVVSVDDRGFVFGDGVYEVIRVIRGAPFEPERHCARLEHGLSELRIAGAAEAETPAALLEITSRLLAENALEDGEATIYVQVTRGAAPRSHIFPETVTPPTVFVAVSRFSPPETLRERGAATITHPDLRWGRCDLKTVNLLPNVLAKQRAHEAGAAEAILVRDGAITEGSHTTVFGVVDGRLRTHPLCSAILPGVTRAVILELAAALALTVDETPLLAREMGRVDELFLAGTTTDVTPVIRVDDRQVGTGRPGPITRALADALRTRMEPG